MSADGGVRPPVGGTTEHPTVELGPWLSSVRTAFQFGYVEDQRRSFGHTAESRAWHRVNGWAETRNGFAVTIATAVAAEAVPSASLVGMYRAVSARHAQALQRALGDSE